MRIALDTEETNSEPTRSATPKEVEWVPLEKHPVFVATNNSIDGDSGTAFSRNLVAWDGSSRLYFWEPKTNCLHRLSLRLGEPEPTSILAASPSKVLRADVEINFAIHKISINRNGSALLLFGSERLCVMYLYGRTSKKDVNLICRTIMIGSQTYSKSSNDIRVLKALWHPYSDCHVGILSSDSVFRLFNLALDPLQPEQEYYLQPVDPGRSRSASSMLPVDFSFGGDHLWDKFSVFILFGDGAIYILCPVVPFGSLFKSESVLEIYNDAHTFGLKSANSRAISNSKLAISWLEATFPELQNQETEENMSMQRAHAYAQFDASLTLQGPLRRVGQGGDEDSVGRSAECEGRAVSLLYDLVSKDTILVTSWSGGQLQIDALADEIQPVWSADSSPRLRVDSHDHILGLAMICESITGGLPEKIDHAVWLGNPPPLLRLAIVDLALPRRAESGYNIALFVDPLMPERIYSLHDGGIDSIVLHFLPFTSQANGKDDTMRTPSVHPVLNTCQSGSTTASPLCGFASLSDSFGYSWIVAVTLSQECIVLETKTWNLLLPPNVGMEEKPIQLEDESEERDIPTIISKELLSGPRTVLVPQASPTLRSISPDSIEGRSALHQYFKLFHETYVEYAHKVYLELKHHAPQLKKIIDDQHDRLADAQQKLLKVAEKQPLLEKRIDRAVQMHSSLEERLQQLRKLPGAHNKPLSRAEQQFKSELDHFREVELDALHSSVDALSARLRRFLQSSKANSHQKQITGRKSHVDKAQKSMLKSSLEKLSLLNSENTRKVKVVESLLRTREKGRRESSVPRP
ncbi:nuclear pore complex protein NUP88 [Neltuma alba]|uniref:nuclear pore complex protein NUP88 n=1 Tax=Neltuma alba TaxID=207710 RepID=UPI0010A50BCA|nr:nuclear pore complex protein NUP88-like [Prosopis alba]